MIGNSVSSAAQFLKEGKLVAIPTETVYGLAANALDPIAVSKIFEAKERPSFNPLILHVSGISEVEKYTRSFPKKARKLAEHFWPGPLSLLLEKKDLVPDLVTAGMPTVVVRVPRHPMTLDLLKQLDFPLAAPSANKFKSISPTLPVHVERSLGDRLDYILDGGPSTIGVESTIVDCRADDPVILRFGGIEKEAIEAVVGEVQVRIKSHSNPQVPGQMDQHYSTRKPLIIIDNLNEIPDEYRNKKVSTIRLSNEVPQGEGHHYTLAPATGTLNEAATHLFRIMHQADEDESEVILAEPVPSQGLGLAINDRLERASHP